MSEHVWCIWNMFPMFLLLDKRRFWWEKCRNVSVDSVVPNLPWTPWKSVKYCVLYLVNNIYTLEELIKQIWVHIHLFYHYTKFKMHWYTPMYKGLLCHVYDFLAQKRQIQHLARAIPITIFPWCQFHIDLFSSEPEVFPDCRDNLHCCFHLVACFLEQVVTGTQFKACRFVAGQGKPVDHVYVCKYRKAIEH